MVAPTFSMPPAGKSMAMIVPSFPPIQPQQQSHAQVGFGMPLGGQGTLSPIPSYQPLHQQHSLYEYGIKEPHHNDVLCGRGVSTAKHDGNLNFRKLVGRNKELYVSSTKKGKMTISRSIVEIIRKQLDPPGRFLEMEKTSKTWFDVGDKKAVEKTSQALRDEAAQLRKQLTADLDIVALDDLAADDLKSLSHGDDGDAVVSPVNSSSIELAATEVSTTKDFPKQEGKRKFEGANQSSNHKRRVSRDPVISTVTGLSKSNSCKRVISAANVVCEGADEKHTETNMKVSTLFCPPLPLSGEVSGGEDPIDLSKPWCDEHVEDISEEDGEILGELLLGCNSPSRSEQEVVTCVSSAPVQQDYGFFVPVDSQQPHAHQGSQVLDMNYASAPASPPLVPPMTQNSSHVILVINGQQLQGGSLIYMPPQQHEMNMTPSAPIFNQASQFHSYYIPQTGQASLHNVQYQLIPPNPPALSQLHSQAH